MNKNESKSKSNDKFMIGFLGEFFFYEIELDGINRMEVICSN